MKVLKYKSVRIASIFIILNALSQVILKYFMGFLIVDSMDELKNVLIILGVTTSIVVIFLYIELRMKKISSYYISQDLRQKLDKSLVHMSYDEYNSKDQGERLSSYINDIPRIRELTVDKYFSMVNYLFTSIWTFVALAKIHVSVVVIAIISAVTMVVVPSILQKKLSEHISKIQKEKEIFTSKYRELLQGFNTFLENSGMCKFLEKTRLVSIRYSQVDIDSGEFTAFMSAVLTGLNFLTNVIGLGVISYFVIKGHVQVGALISVLNLLPNFGASVVQFISERQFFNSGKELYEEKLGHLIKEDYSENKYYTGFRRINDFQTIEYDSHYISEDIETIELRDLVVYYDEDTIVFPKDLIFEKGKKYGIVGESGCGKSTLLKVILGQISEYGGEKVVNGKLSTEVLFDDIAYVSQNTFLFNDSIRNNIDINGLYSDKVLEDVLYNLNLLDFSLDYTIKDNGKNLSGGQRQRLSIARSILNDKKILIIDEGTSSLDRSNADVIEKYLFEKFDTIIMVTHRLSEEIEHKLDKKIVLGGYNEIQ